MARTIGILAGNSASQYTGAIFVLCVIASIASVVIFACGHRSMKKKSNQNNRKRPDITYYGTTGGAYANDYYGGKAGKGRNNNGLNVAAGVGAGIATAVVLDAAFSGGGGGCGGGGCGGGGCGGGGCGGGGCGGGGC